MDCTQIKELVENSCQKYINHINLIETDLTKLSEIAFKHGEPAINLIVENGIWPEVSNAMRHVVNNEQELDKLELFDYGYEKHSIFSAANSQQT